MKRAFLAALLGAAALLGLPAMRFAGPGGWHGVGGRGGSTFCEREHPSTPCYQLVAHGVVARG
jgi:hypothetical protein